MSRSKSTGWAENTQVKSKTCVLSVSHSTGKTCQAKTSLWTCFPVVDLSYHGNSSDMKYQEKQLSVQGLT